MKSNKVLGLIVAASIVIAIVVFNSVAEMRASKERSRLENILAPVIAQAVEGTPEPKPTLFFITTSPKSLVVVLQWGQSPEGAIKQDMRSRVAQAVTRELAADPASWGRYVSVIFSDEVVTQGKK